MSNNPIPSSGRRHSPKLIAIAVLVFAVAAAVAGCGGTGNSSGSSRSGSGGAKLYTGIGTPSSEYFSDLNKGAEAVANSTDSSFQSLASDFNGQKAIENFSNVFARGCEECAVVVDPAESAAAESIVRDAVNGGGWIITLWNKPEDFHPWDEDEHWVAHTTFNGLESGEKNTEALIEAIGGKGNIVALRGVPDNPPAIERREGMLNVLKKYPQVHLLDEEVANWEEGKAQEITETWLAKYGSELNGIFSASDSMSLGALQALRSKDLNGKVPVTGNDGQTPALEAVRDGEMVSDMNSNGAPQGAYAMALAYAAESGEIDVSKLSHAQREFYMKQTFVTKDNVDEVLNEQFNPAEYTYEKLKKNLWGNSAGPIPSTK